MTSHTGSSVLPRKKEQNSTAEPIPGCLGPQMPPLQFPALPPSACVSIQGEVERPPKPLAIFGGWRPHHLLMTMDGHLHCFLTGTDVGEKDAVWSLEPKKGAGYA